MQEIFDVGATIRLARMNHCLRERTRRRILDGGRFARPRLELLEERRLLSTITVTNSSASGTGSLAAAIGQANGQPGDTIEFEMGSSDVTSPITLSSPLEIAANVAIEGPVLESWRSAAEARAGCSPSAPV